MSPTDIPNARQAWTDWIEKVTNQVSNLLWDQYYFDLSLRAAEKGGYIEASNEVYQLFARMYIVHARMAIRRLLDKDEGTYSLRVLLEKMAKNPQVITRDWFVRDYPSFLSDNAQREFDELAGTGAQALSASVPRAMLDELDKAVAPIAAGTDKFVAHYDRKHIPSPPSATFADISNAIAVIDRIAMRSKYILRQVGSKSCAPSNIDECDADCWHVWAGEVPPKGSD